MPRVLYDLTRPLGTATPSWPGDTPFAHRWTVAHGAGAAAVSAITLSPHLGTHLDAPLHVVEGAADAASVPPETCFGPCQVVRAGGDGRLLSPSDLPAGWSPVTARVLFATGAWPAGAPLPERFPGLSPELVDLLAGAGVCLVGVDTPSVDPADEAGLPAHHRCAAHGMLILEGLDLTGVPPGHYLLAALPLPLLGVEASPVRAVLLEDHPRATEHPRMVTG